MNTTMLAAFGLVLVFEGLMPFVAPSAWRETFKRMIQLKDGQLRFVGLLSILGGLFLLFLSR
ncbi:MAG: DUF2065 domain-containing protein [Methylophilaceae bacterium]